MNGNVCLSWKYYIEWMQKSLCHETSIYDEWKNHFIRKMFANTRSDYSRPNAKDSSAHSREIWKVLFPIMRDSENR